MANKFNKSTGLFGMGGGRRKGAKSKLRDFIDQRRKGKASRMQAKRYKKMSDQERKERVMAAKKRRSEFMDSKGKTSSVVKTNPTVSTSSTPKYPAPVARQTAENNKRVLSNQKAEAAVKPGERYVRVMKDGSKKTVIKPNIKKMKAVKKAPGGAAMKKMSMYADGGKVKVMAKGGKLSKKNMTPDQYAKRKAQERIESRKPKTIPLPERKPKIRPLYADGGKMPKYKDGGALKSVPSEAKGLAKLPTSVRNKMGYMKHGGKVKAMYGAKMKKAMYGAKMKK